MSQAKYQIYQTEVFDLVRSLVIHCPMAAEAMNKEVEYTQSVNYADPESWRYYMNLAGDYHATDENMRVKSLDTFAEIDFNKTNLTIHRNTKQVYQQGGEFYRRLVDRFPKQEILIRGILNPIPYAVSTKATECQILDYRRDLVEENETNLMPTLEQWVKKWWARWVVPAYHSVDDLYIATMFAKLTMILPMVVMNIRLRNCNTHYAHSFHIKEHLASHGQLDIYADFLTKKQLLWLYRNAIYLKQNAGKRQTFDVLVKNLFTERSLPIAEWQMRHNSKQQLSTIRPEIDFYREPINLNQIASDTDTRTLMEILDKEQPLARENIKVQPNAFIESNFKMKNSLKSELKTKLLESSVLDLSESVPYTLVDNLLNHWIYWASTDRLKTMIAVDHPRTGSEFVLSIQEAFVVFLFTYNQANGIILKEIPPLVAHMVRREPRPTLDELYALVDSDYLPHVVVDQIAAIWSPLETEYISIPGFYDKVHDIWIEKLKQRELYANVEHYIGRAQAQAVMEYHFMDAYCAIDAGTNYQDWFDARGLNIASLSQAEAELLANQIFSICTSTTLQTTQSLKDIQAAMLKLMSRLSSYSIQFVQSINATDVRIVDWPLQRAGNHEAFIDHKEYIFSTNLGATHADAKMKNGICLDLDDIGVTVDGDGYWNGGDDLDIGLEIEIDSPLHLHAVLNVGAPQVFDVIHDYPDIDTDVLKKDTHFYQPPNTLPISNVLGSTKLGHYSLTAQEKNQLQQKWNLYQTGQTWTIPLYNLLSTHQLPSLLPHLK